MHVPAIAARLVNGMAVEPGTGARAEVGTKRDRRAPVVAKHEIALEPRRFQDELLAFEGLLRSLDSEVRRPIRVLLGQLLAQWLALEGPVGSMMVRVSVFPSRIRVDVSGEPGGRGYAFWESLVAPHIEALASHWGMDRRSAGVWFEIERGAPSGSLP